jgi:hypothetical protein
VRPMRRSRKRSVVIGTGSLAILRAATDGPRGLPRVSRSVTIERWSTEHGDCVLRSPERSHIRRDVAMRRLAFSGESGRRLAEGDERRRVMLPACRL